MKLLRASFCLAMFLMLMVLSNATAQDVIEYVPPKTLLSEEFIWAWPAVLGSLLISIPISAWFRRRANLSLNNSLRHGGCMKASGDLMRKAAIQGSVIMLALGVACPSLIDALRQFGWRYELTNQFLKVYADLAYVPEAAAEQVMAPVIRDMRGYKYSPYTVTTYLNGEPGDPNP